MRQQVDRVVYLFQTLQTSVMQSACRVADVKGESASAAFSWVNLQQKVRLVGASTSVWSVLQIGSQKPAILVHYLQNGTTDMITDDGVSG